MQRIVLEEPYRFVPPTRGHLWPAIITALVDPYMRRNYGVTSHEVRGARKLRESIAAGHGIVLVANHSRPCDPIACGWLSRAVGQPFFCMASWHTFMGPKMERFLIRRCGAYSIYREGTDHASLTFTVDALVNAERPVVMCAEGSVTRQNDRIAPLLEGFAFTARMAAKRRAKQSPPGKVVIHPFVLKYFFRGHLEGTLGPVVSVLEARFGWPPQNDLPLLDRVRRLEDALLTLRELEYFGAPQRGPDSSPRAGDRAIKLLERILEPLEAEWFAGESKAMGAFARIQALRARILPEIVAGKVTPQELARRRKQLADLYVAQTLKCHPENCLEGDFHPDRIVEAVERIEEDLTDVATTHGPLHLVIDVGDAIEVEPERQRGREEPLVPLVRQRMTQLITDLQPPEELQPPGASDD